MVQNRWGTRPHHQPLENEMNETLKSSIADRFKNTALGFFRIKRNLGIVGFSDSETEDFLKKIILATPVENIETKGKNYYFMCIKFNVILTVNVYSFTIIMAKLIANDRSCC